jgi:hypothetical protein
LILSVPVKVLKFLMYQAYQGEKNVLQDQTYARWSEYM